MSESALFHVSQLAIAALLPFLISSLSREIRWHVVISISGILLFLGLLSYWSHFIAGKKSVSVVEVFGGPGVYTLAASSFLLALPVLAGATLLAAFWCKR